MNEGQRFNMGAAARRFLTDRGVNLPALDEFELVEVIVAASRLCPACGGSGKARRLADQRVRRVDWYCRCEAGVSLRFREADAAYDARSGLGAPWGGDAA